MTYIIDPMWFYWLSVVDALQDVICGLAVFSGVVVTGVGVWGFIEGFDDCPNLRKFFVTAIVILVVSFFAFVFVPSRETLITMKVSEFATYENAEIAIDSIQSAVDYIIEAISEIGGKTK